MSKVSKAKSGKQTSTKEIDRKSLNGKTSKHMFCFTRRSKLNTWKILEIKIMMIWFDSGADNKSLEKATKGI